MVSFLPSPAHKDSKVGQPQRILVDPAHVHAVEDYGAWLYLVLPYARLQVDAEGGEALKRLRFAQKSWGIQTAYLSQRPPEWLRKELWDKYAITCGWTDPEEQAAA